MAEDLHSYGGGGLNDITQLVTDIDEEQLNCQRRFLPLAMEKTGSRIPKLGFGFKKPTAGKPGHLSEGNTPRAVISNITTRPMTPTDSLSAPGSQNSSPNLSRSKSMRTPRSGYNVVRIQPSSSAVPDQSRAGNGKAEVISPRLPVRSKLRPPMEVAEDTSGLSRARSKTIGSSSGLVRPSVQANGTSQRTAWRGRERGVDVGQEEEEEGEEFQGSPQPETEDLSPLKRDRRTKSFSVKTHTRTNGTSTTPPTSSSSSSGMMARANSVRRSKTPTSLGSSVRSSSGGERAGAVNGQGMVRTGSQGVPGRYIAKLTPPPHQADKVQMRRAVSSAKPPRPLSSYISEESTPDGGEESGKGFKGKRSHSSLDYSHVPSDTTPTSTPTGSGRVTPNKPSRYLAIKNRTSSLENSGGSRPRSATAHYQQPAVRRQSGPTKESSPGKTEDSRTPSSGRSTPVMMRGVARDSTDGGVMSTGRSTNSSLTTTTTATTTTSTSAGLPPRTPYRVARTKAAPSNSLAGMNELEGSVLLEADDYRRLVNEVKALKTALLKLKRELQEGSEDAPASPTGQVCRSKTTPLPGQGTPADQNKKLRAMGKERDAATDEVTRLKKEVKSRESKIESLSKELADSKEKTREVEEELKMVGEQRNRLVDKVERLHAEKHQIEARLNTLERASMYEQTWSDNWLDELDGEDNEALRRSLESDKHSYSDGGRTKGSSGSDVVDSGMQSDGDVDESSEPEGLSISYAARNVI